MIDDKNAEFLYLTTTGWQSGDPHEIEIWFTEWEHKYYLIAERGAEAHWVQNLQHNPAVTVWVYDAMFRATARVIAADSEPTLHERISALSTEKYGWGNGLIVELAPVASF